MKNKLFRNIRKQVSAKKNTTGSIVITILLIVAFLSTFLVFIPEQVSAASYGDFASVKELTIESDYIDTELTNFPLLIHDDTGDLLGNILANASDIAFFNSSKATQFNHEIEWYNSTTGELIAWVNVTPVASGTDTTLYMYYDDSDGGYPIGYNPTDVWDSDYEAVFHLTDLNDSTSNGWLLINNGTAVTNDSGQMAGCYDFEADNTAYLYNDTLLNGVYSSLNVECWVNHESGTTDNEYIVKYNVLSDDRLFFRRSVSDFSMFLEADASGNKVVGGSTPSYNSWYYISGSYQSGLELRLNLNGTETVSLGDLQPNTMQAGDYEEFLVGIFSSTTYGNPMDGLIDEIRISNIARSNETLKASFHSMNETTGFLTLGAAQGGAESSYSIKGLTSDRVTWSGTAGTTVWCNSSGDGNEWLEINMTINATDNVTELRVWMDDLNDTSAYINASNITMYVSSDNSSYGEIGTFTDSGSNCSDAINATNWNAGTMGADPFAGEGLTNDSFEIYLIFTLAIPADTPTDIFWSAASDSLKVYIGSE